MNIYYILLIYYIYLMITTRIDSKFIFEETSSDEEELKEVEIEEKKEYKSATSAAIATIKRTLPIPIKRTESKTMIAQRTRSISSSGRSPSTSSLFGSPTNKPKFNSPSSSGTQAIMKDLDNLCKNTIIPNSNKIWQLTNHFYNKEGFRRGAVVIDATLLSDFDSTMLDHIDYYYVSEDLHGISKLYVETYDPDNCFVIVINYTNSIYDNMHTYNTFRKSENFGKHYTYCNTIWKQACDKELRLEIIKNNLSI